MMINKILCLVTVIISCHMFRSKYRRKKKIEKKQIIYCSGVIVRSGRP